jgi:broad specificity phosphatase PhoE
MGRACKVILAPLAAALVLVAGLPTVWAAEDAWALLRMPGHVVFMRHSEAPGGAGDPPGFRLDECATQRNLSEDGRAHARRTGEAFRKNGVALDRVLTSPWCRCRETALLAIGREAEPMEALSNLVGRQQHAAGQVEALKAYLASLDQSTRVLFVTHGIVINALTGISPASGEMVIVRLGEGGGPVVAARLRVD